MIIYENIYIILNIKWINKLRKRSDKKNYFNLVLYMKGSILILSV